MPVIPESLATVDGPLFGTFFSQGGQLTVGSCDLWLRQIDRNGDPIGPWRQAGRYDKDGFTLKTEVTYGSYEDDAGNMKSWGQGAKVTLSFPSSQLAVDLWLLMYQILLEMLPNETDPTKLDGIALVNPAGRLTDDFAFELRAIHREDGVPSNDRFKALQLFRVVPASGMEIKKSSDPAQISVQLEAREGVNKRTPGGRPMIGFIGLFVAKPIVRAYQEGVGLPAGGPVEFGGPHSTVQSRLLEIENFGSANLDLAALALSGTDAAHFEVTRPAGTPVAYPVTIAPGQRASFRLRFGIASPTPGAKSATLAITSNASPWSAALTGSIA